jgi:hypothetical protein
MTAARRRGLECLLAQGFARGFWREPAYERAENMTNDEQENHALRERDLYAWCTQTEILLSQSRFREIDWEAIARELERSAEVNDAASLREAVETLLTQLAIWNLSPNYHTAQRRNKIESARFRLEEILSRSPSLVAKLDLQWKELYTRARFSAMLIVADPRIASDPPPSTLAEVIRTQSESEAQSCAIRRRLRLVMYSGEHYDSENDHYAWCSEQAAAARAKRISEVDPLGVAEELASLGTSVRRALTESLALLVDSLIAWKAGSRHDILRRKISAGRSLVRAILWQNPSLALVADLAGEAYGILDKRAVPCSATEGSAVRWTLGEMLDDTFLVE